MALITAVVSVTNISFDSNNSGICSELHCHLPHRFLISEDYDIPHFGTKGNVESSISSIIQLIQSIFQWYHRKNNVISFNQSISFNKTDFTNKFIQYIQEFLSKNNVNIEIRHLSFNNIISIFYEFISAKPLLNIASQLSYSIEIETFISEHTVQSIKSLLFNATHPLLLHIPSPLSFSILNGEFFFNTEKFPEYQALLLYGWNNDYVFKCPFNESTYTGGFIAKSANSLGNGHLLSYLYGDITRTCEELLCPNMNSPSSWNFLPFSNIDEFDEATELLCTNERYCDVDGVYYLLSSPTNNAQPWIDQDGLYYFLKIKNNSKIIEPISRKLIEIDSSCIQPSNFQEHNFNCDNVIIPYELIEKLNSKAHRANKVAFALDCGIKIKPNFPLPGTTFNIEQWEERPNLYMC